MKDLNPNPKNGFQIIISHAFPGFTRVCFKTFSYRKITSVAETSRKICLSLLFV